MSESNRAAGDSPEHALALARAALDAGPSGLLTDFDGTLSPIVEDPALARLVEGAEGALALLAERLAVVAVVTGRRALEARRLIGVPGLLVVGNHGAEWLEPGEEQPSWTDAAAGAEARLDRLLAALPTLRGVTVEHKGLSATVHYRRSPDPGTARSAILDSLRDAPAVEVDLREGRMSVELRPRGLGDKGAAARRIIERHSLRGVVVMGDDVTDLDMFRVVAQLREGRGVRAAIIGVGGRDREVPREVMGAADSVLPDPADAAALLTALSEPAPPGPRAGGGATR